MPIPLRDMRLLYSDLLAAYRAGRVPWRDDIGRTGAMLVQAHSLRFLFRPWKQPVFVRFRERPTNVMPGVRIRDVSDALEALDTPTLLALRGWNEMNLHGLRRRPNLRTVATFGGTAVTGLVTWHQLFGISSLPSLVASFPWAARVGVILPLSAYLTAWFVVFVLVFDAFFLGPARRDVRDFGRLIDVALTLRGTR